MAKALRLAERGRGTTSPNPMVGALVVDGDGVVVGRGAHEVAGGPHAEVRALGDAGERARGATLYCTLEPCSHHGRTGPCAPLVADAGIRRVVIATGDPNPLVAGRGLALLRSRGVQVTEGVLTDAAAALNAPFFTAMQKARPFVTMKVALSLDGMVAGEGGARIALTGRKANLRVHRDRAEADALAVGSGTILADDPQLTCRLVVRRRPLTRVIFDSRLRTSPRAAVFSTLAAGPVIIVSSAAAVSGSPEGVAGLEAAGARITALAEGEGLAGSLAGLLEAGVQSLIVEGGPRLHRAFWDAGLVDRVQLYVTPAMVGDSGTRWIDGAVLTSWRTMMSAVTWVEPDVLMEAYVHRTH